MLPHIFLFFLSVSDGQKITGLNLPIISSASQMSVWLGWPKLNWPWLANWSQLVKLHSSVLHNTFHWCLLQVWLERTRVFLWNLHSFASKNPKEKKGAKASQREWMQKLRETMNMIQRDMTRKSTDGNTEMELVQSIPCCIKDRPNKIT